MLTFFNPQIKKQIDLRLLSLCVFVQDKKIAAKERRECGLRWERSGGERSQGAVCVCWMEIKNGGDSLCSRRIHSVCSGRKKEKKQNTRLNLILPRQQQQRERERPTAATAALVCRICGSFTLGIITLPENDLKSLSLVLLARTDPHIFLYPKQCLMFCMCWCMLTFMAKLSILFIFSYSSSTQYNRLSNLFICVSSNSGSYIFLLLSRPGEEIFHFGPFCCSRRLIVRLPPHTVWSLREKMQPHIMCILYKLDLEEIHATHKSWNMIDTWFQSVDFSQSNKMHQGKYF